MCCHEPLLDFRLCLLLLSIQVERMFHIRAVINFMTRAMGNNIIVKELVSSVTMND